MRILSPQRLPFRHPGMLSATRILPSLSFFPKRPMPPAIRQCGTDEELVHPRSRMGPRFGCRFAPGVSAEAEVFEETIHLLREAAHKRERARSHQ